MTTASRSLQLVERRDGPMTGPLEEARDVGRVRRLCTLTTYDFTAIGPNTSIDPGMIIAERVPIWGFAEFVVVARVHRINLAAQNVLNVDVVEDFWSDEDPSTSFVQPGGLSYTGMIMSFPLDSNLSAGRALSTTAYQYSHKCPYLAVRLRPTTAGQAAPFDIDISIDLYLRCPA